MGKYEAHPIFILLHNAMFAEAIEQFRIAYVEKSGISPEECALQSFEQYLRNNSKWIDEQIEQMLDELLVYAEQQNIIKPNRPIPQWIASFFIVPGMVYALACEEYIFFWFFFVTLGSLIFSWYYKRID